jgi:hypothetical protein
MEQLAIVARLKEGAEPKAAALLAKGAPFDLAELGFARHTVFLSADEVVFAFEGHEVEWKVDQILTDPFQWEVSAAFEGWRDLLEGPPRIARPAFAWEQSSSGVQS